MMDSCEVKDLKDALSDCRKIAREKDRRIAERDERIKELEYAVNSACKMQHQLDASASRELDAARLRIEHLEKAIIEPELVKTEPLVVKCEGNMIDCPLRPDHVVIESRVGDILVSEMGERQIVTKVGDKYIVTRDITPWYRRAYNWVRRLFL